MPPGRRSGHGSPQSMPPMRPPPPTHAPRPTARRCPNLRAHPCQRQAASPSPSSATHLTPSRSACRPNRVPIPYTVSEGGVGGGGGWAACRFARCRAWGWPRLGAPPTRPDHPTPLHPPGGVMDCVKKTLKWEGVGGLYKASGRAGGQGAVSAGGREGSRAGGRAGGRVPRRRSQTHPFSLCGPWNPSLGRDVPAGGPNVLPRHAVWCVWRVQALVVGRRLQAADARPIFSSGRHDGVRGGVRRVAHRFLQVPDAGADRAHACRSHLCR